MEPGIYQDVPAEQYHKLDYVSATYLKRFRENPAGALLPFESTEDMLVGQAIHAYSLEGPAAFYNRFAVMFASELNKNTTVYKGLKAEFEEKNAGKIVLPAYYKKTPTIDVLKGVDAALKTHPMASVILKQGFRELTLIWDDEETGLRCKARVDHEPGKRVLADLKKTADVNRFRNQIVDLSYDVQAGWYVQGARACGLDPDTFVFIAVEAEPPYAVKCGYLLPEWLAWAETEARRLLHLVKECRETQCFPAYQIPGHLCSLSQLTPHDLMEEWAMPQWR